MRNNALRKIHFNAQEIYKKEEQIHIAFFSDQKSFYLFHVGSVASTGSHSLSCFFLLLYFTLIKEIVLFVDILKFSRNKKKLSKICNKRNDIVILLHDDGV